MPNSDAIPWKIHLLGTTGYHPNENRQTSCTFLPASGILLDAGTAIFRIRDLIQTDTLDIFLTHAHLDHVVGLTFLLDVLHERGVEQIRIHGEADKLEAVQTHLFSELLFPVRLENAIFLPLQAGQSIDCQGVKVEPFALPNHPGGSVGYRLTKDERSLAYVTDTTASADASYLEKIRGADVLVHECNFADGFEELADRTGHSTLTPVAELARQAEVGRLVLTHFNSLADSPAPLGLSTAKTIFPEMELGQDGMVLTL